jgi:hypothetical protein
MLFSNACRFVLFSLVSLSANAETVRGAQRELVEAKVDLGYAENFAIFAKTGISTVPQSTITGDIAVYPITGDAITGFGPFLTMHSSGEYSTDGNNQIKKGDGQDYGKAYAASYGAPTPTHLITVVGDMEGAYTNAAGRPNADASRKNLGAGTLTDEVLTPGVYTFSTGVLLTGSITFDAADSDGTDDPDAVFIIQIAGNLKQYAGKNVILQNGAKAENIFWQIAGNVEIMGGAHMEGILLVKTDITFITGSSLNGRALAQTACNLQVATITEPDHANIQFP